MNEHKHWASPTSKLPIDELGDEIATLCARLDATQHVVMTRIREFDQRKGWAKQGAKSCAHWLSWRVGWSITTARERVRVARALGELPQIDASLREGTVSYSKVRAMTRVATPDTEALLLRQAKTATATMLDEVCRGVRRTQQLIEAPRPERTVRRRCTRRGMTKIEITIHHDEAEAVWQALLHTRERLEAESKSPGTHDAPAGASSGEAPGTHDASAGASSGEALGIHGAPAGAPSALQTLGADSRPSLADAVVVIAEDAMAGPRGRPRKAPERRTLFVHLQQDQLMDAVKAETHDHRPLRLATLQRIACDCGLVAVARGEDGHVLAMTAKRRTVSEPMRRMLMIRDRHCVFPGCRCSLYLEAHHVRHWLDGGETSLDNLVLLCWTHHALVHREGFCARHVDGEVEFFRPDGLHIPRAPQPPPYGGDPVTDLVADQDRAGIPIDARTALVDWDGTSRDWRAGVEAVVRRMPWGQQPAEPPPSR